MMLTEMVDSSLGDQWSEHWSSPTCRELPTDAPQPRTVGTPPRFTPPKSRAARRCGGWRREDR
jgi:hypothetical protein